MRTNDIELTILVKNRRITEYHHNDLSFVEGRAGSEYEIEVCNHTCQRIEAVVSVDGLSVLDGKLAGAESRGYLIAPQGVIRIPGWRLDAAQVAKFAFAGKKASYATQMTGDACNNGVIGVMAYREKRRPYNPGIFISAGGGPISSYERGIPCSSTKKMSAQPRGITSSGAGQMFMGAQSFNSVEQSIPVQQSLGTAFGAASAFATTMVTFERDGVICIMVLGYDEKRGLKARGIRMTRPRNEPHQPQAFPAMTCPPPPGWRG